MQPFDPLDPKHRAERGRERTAFFRQTNLFPVAVLTMIVFVPLAMFHASLALPFLGWMALMTHVVASVDRVMAALLGSKPLLRGSLVLAAVASAGIFLVVGLLLSPFLLWFAGGGLCLLYIFGIITGRLWVEEETP